MSFFFLIEQLERHLEPDVMKSANLSGEDSSNELRLRRKERQPQPMAKELMCDVVKETKG